MGVEGAGLDCVLGVPRALFLLLPGPSRTCIPSRMACYGHIPSPSLWLGSGFWANRARKVSGCQHLKHTHWSLGLAELWEEKVGCGRRCGERGGASVGSRSQACFPWKGEPGRVLVASALPSQGPLSGVPGPLGYEDSMKDCLSPPAVTTASALSPCCQPSQGRLPAPQ